MYLPGMCKRLAEDDGFGFDAWGVGPVPVLSTSSRRGHFVRRCPRFDTYGMTGEKNK